MTYGQSRFLCRGHFGDTALGLRVLRPKAGYDSSLNGPFRLGHGLSLNVHGDFSRAVPQEFLHDFYAFSAAGCPDRMHERRCSQLA